MNFNIPSKRNFILLIYKTCPVKLYQRMPEYSKKQLITADDEQNAHSKLVLILRGKKQWKLSFVYQDSTVISTYKKYLGIASYMPIVLLLWGRGLNI